MQNWTIEQYDPTMRDLWNRVNAESRNATFLTDRDYMDYHSHRFKDNSIIARKGNKAIVLLPANLTSDGVLHSHQGLTYGGWILPTRHFDCVDMMRLWNVFLEYCESNSIREIDYKPIPNIYAKMPSDEDIYALFRHGGTIRSCNISAAIKLGFNPGFNEMRRRQLKKAPPIETESVSSEDDYNKYHRILADCLSSRHNAIPVHSASEMFMLAKRFPDNISLWVAKLNGEIHAGCWLFRSRKTVHVQYIASTASGRENNLLTSLFAHLIKLAGNGYFGPEVEYFDFGTNNENGGLILNENLYRQKASMGASAVAYMRYSLKI